MAGGVIRLSPARSKTLVGRILPISPPIAEALARRRARRDPDSPLVFHRDGIPVRRWRTTWRTACQAAGVPTRFLHDCRRIAARNLIRASVPERDAMLLTGHKSRAIFDRYNIINEQELFDAGDQLVEYLAQQVQAVPARRRPPRPATPPRAPHRPSASCDAPPHKPPHGISSPLRGGGSRTPPVCALRIASRPPSTGRPVLGAHAATGRANGIEHGLPPHFLPLARHGVEGVPSRCQTPSREGGGAPVRNYSAGRLRRSPAGARRRPPARSSGCCITPASAWARVDHDNARRP